VSDNLNVGIDIKVHDHLSKVLLDYGKTLDGLHKKLGLFKSGFAGAAGPKAVAPGITKALTLAREQAKIKVLDARTEKQIADLKAKSGQLAKVDAEKLNREVEKTREVTEKISQITAKGGRQAVEDALRRDAIVSNMATKEQTHFERLAQLKQSGARAESLGREKQITETLRQLQLQERISKLQGKSNAPVLTADQARVRAGAQAIQGLKPTSGNLIAYGQRARQVGLTGVAGFVHFGHREEVHELQKEQAAIGGLNLSARDNATLYGGARRLRTGMGITGLDQASALEVVRHVHGITANADEAVRPELMGAAAKFMLASKTNYGHSILQLQRGMQSAEMMIQAKPEWAHMSKSQVDDAKVRQIIDNMNVVYKMSSGSAGMNKPSETRMMLTQMRSAKIGMSPQAMYDYSGIQREKGGAVTGTMLAAFSTNLINLHATDQIIANVKKAGLLDSSSKLVHDKKGKIDFKHSELHIKGFAEANVNQVAWFNKYLKPLVDKIEVKGKDGKLDATATVAAKKQFLEGIGGRGTTRDELTMLYFQNDLLRKESEVTRKAAGIDKGFATTPAYAKADARYEAAKNSVVQAISPAVMEQSARALNMAAAGLEGIAKVIEAHPGLAKMGAIAFGLFSVGSVVGGVGVQIAGVILALKAFRTASALTAAMENLAAGEMNTASATMGGAGRRAAASLAGVGGALGALTLLAGAAAFAFYAIKKTQKDTDDYDAALHREARDAMQVEKLQRENAAKFGHAPPSSHVGQKLKDIPSFPKAQFTVIDGGLSAQAQDIRAGALTAPTLADPHLDGPPSGGSGVHMPVTVNVHMPAGSTTPGEARGAARKAGRILEETVYHHLINGARQPTQTAPNRLR
jgi:hypothetical protein